MNSQITAKCYPCGKIETNAEFLMNFEDQKICFKCMIIIAGMTFEEDLCVISAIPSGNNIFKQLCDEALRFINKSKYLKFLIPATHQRIINRQKKSDCYINPATFMPREKRHTYFVLMKRPFEVN